MTKKTFLQALREIRPLIESGHQCFICFALKSIGCQGFSRRIHKQLEGYSTYGDWLFDKHHEFRNTVGDLRTGRLAWIDDMIAREIKAGRK